MDEIDEAQELEQPNVLGGVLKCPVCSYTIALGDPRRREVEGWPKHCLDLTMLWVVGREERVG